jgi:leucyl aminopeptidase
VRLRHDSHKPVKRDHGNVEGAYSHWCDKGKLSGVRYPLANSVHPTDGIHHKGQEQERKYYRQDALDEVGDDRCGKSARHAVYDKDHGHDRNRRVGREQSLCAGRYYLARTAKKLASGNGKLTTKVLSEADMKRLGMGSLLSVTAGSTEPAKLIVMKYKNAGSSRPYVLVGKGVTFDTGGISLKPGAGMDEMKYDMCGAASVIGTMAAISRMQLPINVNVVVPAVENMPSSTATKPGDIVKSMSGQTIEVLNTDAEGRMILCDALTYSKRFKPEAIIDVATLTGACVVALGHHRSAIYANNDDLQDELFAAGKTSEDIGWPMPMGPQYAAQLKSNFADMANIGGGGGGSVTAACFLGKYTDGMNWAHLDIAGVAWKSGAQKGATGRPVPMLSEFLLSRAGALP